MLAETRNIRGLYIHIPFCGSICAYCAFYSEIYDAALADRYLSALEREFAETFQRLETVYIGGGTPTILSVPQIERLCDSVKHGTACSRVTEWTVEANPGSLDKDKLQALVSRGVNRISLGAQSFNEKELRLLGRRHGIDDIFRSVDLVRTAGIRNLNLDLIACIPGVSPRQWENTIRQALALAPEHISIYALTLEEGTRLNSAARIGGIHILEDEEQLEILDTAESLLTEAGFIRYEISNYARPGFECRHNVACWRGDEYVGFGASAASHIGMERIVNAPDVIRYIMALENGEMPPREKEALTPALKRAERLVFGLRMTDGVDAELGAEHRRELDALQSEGLVALKDNRWSLTPSGRNLADYVGARLLNAC